MKRLVPRNFMNLLCRDEETGCRALIKIIHERTTLITEIFSIKWLVNLQDFSFNLIPVYIVQAWKLEKNLKTKFHAENLVLLN